MRFVIRRSLQALVVLLGVTVITFVLIHLIPGGPGRALLGPQATPEQITLFEQANGWDRALPVQYGSFLKDLVSGDLGFSYNYNQPITDLISERLQKSLVIVGIAYLIAFSLCIPLGIFQATRRGSKADTALTGVSFLMYAMPVFWLATLMILFFSVKLKWLPPTAPQGDTLAEVLSQPKGLVLPVLAIAGVTVALLTRFMRSAVIEELVQDYVRTARGKGASQRRVVYRHVLRNSLGPLVTFVGLSLPWAVSGTIVTEQVFNYPGMGLLLWDAALKHEYPVLMAFVVVVGAAAVIGSLIADLLYSRLDPRVTSN